MARCIVATLLALVLGGCASSGVQIAPERLGDFKEGTTTEAEVIAKLGPPTGVTTAAGMRLLTYSGADYQTRPATFIPFIGPLVGGVDVRTSMVMFKFDSAGKLVEVVTHRSQSAGASGLTAGSKASVE